MMTALPHQNDLTSVMRYAISSDKYIVTGLTIPGEKKSQELKSHLHSLSLAACELVRGKLHTHPHTHTHTHTRTRARAKCFVG